MAPSEADCSKVNDCPSGMWLLKPSYPPPPSCTALSLSRSRRQTARSGMLTFYVWLHVRFNVQWANGNRRKINACPEIWRENNKLLSQSIFKSAHDSTGAAHTEWKECTLISYWQRIRQSQSTVFAFAIKSWIYKMKTLQYIRLIFNPKQNRAVTNCIVYCTWLTAYDLCVAIVYAHTMIGLSRSARPNELTLFYLCLGFCREQKRIEISLSLSLSLNPISFGPLSLNYS